MEPPLTNGPLSWMGWIENGEMGRVQWKNLPDGTPVQIEARTLPDGRMVMVPFPLWVEIADDRHNRNVQLVGRIQEDGTPAFWDLRVHIYPGEKGWDDASIDEGVSDTDLARWKEKVLEMAVLAVPGEEVEPPLLDRPDRLRGLDRQVTNEMLRALRRKRGRPGRPPALWDSKVKAKQLNDNGMSTRRISATGQFINHHRGRPYSKATIGRWIKEVEAAEQEETPDE